MGSSQKTQRFYFSRWRAHPLLAQTLEKLQMVPLITADPEPQQDTADPTRGQRARRQLLQHLMERMELSGSQHHGLRTVCKVTIERLRSQRYRGWSLSLIKSAWKLSCFFNFVFLFLPFLVLGTPFSPLHLVNSHLSLTSAKCHLHLIPFFPSFSSPHHKW